MLDDQQKLLLIQLETAINEVMENVTHPVHDQKHAKHEESLIAFDKLLAMREELAFLDCKDRDKDE